jgi:hypothetical protein
MTRRHRRVLTWIKIARPRACGAFAEGNAPSGGAFTGRRLIQINAAARADRHVGGARSSTCWRERIMRKAFRSIGIGAAMLGAAVMLASAISPSYADTGTLRVRITKAGFIIGVGGGTGILHFKGKNYRLRVDGISAGTIGVASADLVGTASHLRTASDIAGSYSAVSASVAVAGGAKTARLQNQNGVVIEVHGVQAGFELSLNLSGVTISLQ